LNRIVGNRQKKFKGGRRKLFGGRVQAESRQKGGEKPPGKKFALA